jgi:hypothetical protein
MVHDVDQRRQRGADQGRGLHVGALEPHAAGGRGGTPG